MEDVTDAYLAGVKVFSIAYFTGLVRRFGSSPGTPVATGRARSGWRVARNAWPTFKPQKKGAFFAMPGTDQPREAHKGLRPGDELRYRNRVSYVPILTPGRRFSANANRMLGSKQAPDGWLEQAEREAAKILRNWVYKGKDP